MSPAPAYASSAVPLAHVVRGELLESVHSGHLVVLAPDGAVRFALGEPDAVIWARSSLKPLQGTAMVRTGLDVDSAGLALACASHSGEAVHLAGVRALLAGAGLTEADLQNTPDLPLGPAAAVEWQLAGGHACSLTQNCSGKHAAMLATCVTAGWDTADYLDAAHPLQRAIRAEIERLTGVAVTHATLDGCGAPLFSTTVLGLARAFGRIAGAPQREPGTPQARVATAMSAHPELVGGTGRDATLAMRCVPGLVAKDGADGVYAAGLPDGGALAFKVIDGADRPRPAILAAALAIAGIDSDAIRALGHTPVLGHGVPVGGVTATFGAQTDPATFVARPDSATFGAQAGTS